MIKLEHVVLASPEQMKFIIEGMRNPMNSWEKSDSRTCRQDGAFCMECEHKNDYCLGENDHSLMQRLSNAGTDHRKFMRMLPVYVRITAPLYWWKEFDTYKVGTVANSCSTMHKIQAKEFTMDDFSCEHIHIRQSTDVLKETIDALNVFRDVYLNGGILSYENGNQKCYGKNDKEICQYCIVKNNHLNIPKTTIHGLNNLFSEIVKNRCNWVSLSGGGDPLWKYEQHKDWYEKFFEIVDAAHVNTELHTSLHAVQGVSYNHFDRVVYHLHSLEQLYSIKRENCSIVRIVFVVTEDFTEDMINRIAVFCANSEDIDELSFRQMVDNHYRETYYCHDYLKAGHKKLWWYIEQNDYNLYYCQNHVYTEYKNIGGDSNG